MGIAETDKRVQRDSSDVKAQKARNRSFLKRRAVQLSNCYLQSNWNLCTHLQRQWNRRRLRRLFSSDKHSGRDSNRSNLKQQSWSFFWYTLVPMFLVLCFSCGITLYQNTDAVSKFMQRYSTQYQAIVHNKLNYCDRTIPLHEIFEHIHQNVINQEVALEQLEQALANQSSFQAIALVGTSGVGKSLTMRMLQEQYPWSENVQNIAWNDYELIDEEARYQAVWGMLSNLAHCGRNLIIIDNMAMCDLEYVSSINSLILSNTDVASGNNDLDKKQLTIIYVFNLNGMLPEEHYSQQLKMLQNLPPTTVISYRVFGPADLEKCVRHEAKVVGLNLEERYVEEMVNTTDVKVSGCKTVRSKVLIYGLPQSNDEEEQEQEKHSQTEMTPIEGH